MSKDIDGFKWLTPAQEMKEDFLYFRSLGKEQLQKLLSEKTEEFWALDERRLHLGKDIALINQILGEKH